jgi:hypothetical protein
LKTAGLSLEMLNLANIADHADVWEKVVWKLRTEAMPPAGVPRPDKTSADAFASALAAALDQLAAASPDPGRAPVHRLNRTEYANAVRDLLGIEIDGRSLLPADSSGYGFDNIADVLSVSPGLLERYVAAAGKISRLAVGDPTGSAVTESYRVPRYLLQDDRAGEDAAFGSRGGAVVRHIFPVDGEYVFKVRLQRTWRNEIRGLVEPHPLDIRVDGLRVKQFIVGGGEPGLKEKIADKIKRATFTGTPSEYELGGDRDLEVRVPVKAGVRTVAAEFVKQTSEVEGPLEPPLPLSSFEYAGKEDGDPGVDTLQITGPYNAQKAEDSFSWRKIFVCRPSATIGEEPCARRILSALARRAYRRPVTNGDVGPLLGLYREGRSKGSFDTGIQLAIQNILVDPDFLFRVERDAAVLPGKAYRVSDVELASRLSFFLWSSVPDDELLDVAVRGKLKEPAVLELQVERMLRDQRATSLVTNFAGQWLLVRNMQSVAPDLEQFPLFDDNLRQAFQRETELFVESQLREDRSVIDLLRADYTFVNERLARHYGIQNVYGSHFRRVTLTDDRRFGLLGQGSLLTTTSYSNRTSPVQRGKWLLENVLGAPPPPPPANVPPLKDNGEKGQAVSVRERMEQHRKSPLCASCHARMDPLGFALENFDAIGEWRSTEGDLSIDASGALPDGSKFEGPVGLRRFVLSKSDQFVATVTEKLLTYALGRGVESYDKPTVRRIVRDAAGTEYRWSSIILGIVTSIPFQMRRARES